jgi:uncharacterized protein with HEPN domain
MKDDKLYLIHIIKHDLPKLKAEIEMILQELNDG